MFLRSLFLAFVLSSSVTGDQSLWALKFVRTTLSGPWAVGTADAKVFTQFAVPVYFARPPRPYMMIGYVIVVGEPEGATARSEALTRAAQVSRDNGAEGIWMREPPQGHYLQAVAFRWERK